MKRVLKIIICAVSALILSSCSDPEIKEIRYVKSQMEEVVKCFDNQDHEGLKSLLCGRLQNSPDIDEDIEAMLSLYEGRSTYYTFSRTSPAGGGTKKGKWTDRHFRPLIEDLRTDKNKTYRIALSVYTVYDNDPSYIGICHINLIDTEKNDILYQISCLTD